MLFPWISEVERIRNYSRGISPEFDSDFESKFHGPFVLGKRLFSFRKSLNLYLNVCVAGVDAPFDSIALRRCLSDEGDVEAWAGHIGREIFPILDKYNALLHWHDIAPKYFR